MYYTSKNILNISVGFTFKRLFVIGLEMGIIALVINVIPKIDIISYKIWAVQSIIVIEISSIVVFGINRIAYGGDDKNKF